MVVPYLPSLYPSIASLSFIVAGLGLPRGTSETGTRVRGTNDPVAVQS